jgi:branched-chain amino acid transport system permease protein
LFGVCIVLMYRVVGVVNFAQAAIGGFGAYVMLQLYQDGVGYPGAALIGLATATALAAALGMVMVRWFLDSPVHTRSSVTIAMLVGLLAVGLRLFGDHPKPVPDAFTGGALQVAGVVITQGSVASFLLVLLLAGGLTLLLARTRMGLWLQALSDRPVTAELVGIPVRSLSVGVWSLAGLLSGIATVLITPTRTSSYLALGLLVVPGLAAALLGLFRNLWAAVGGGFAIGIIEGILATLGGIEQYREIVPFIAIVLVLLWSERHEVWDVRR